MRLNLVVSSDGCCVRRGSLAIGAASADVIVAASALLLRLVLTGVAAAAVVVLAGAAVVHAALGLRLVLAARRLDVDVADAAALAVLRQRLVLVGRLRVLGDDVPRVQQARDEPEEAEEDVDERVGAADAALDPD